MKVTESSAQQEPLRRALVHSTPLVNEERIIFSFDRPGGRESANTSEFVEHVARVSALVSERLQGSSVPRVGISTADAYLYNVCQQAVWLLGASVVPLCPGDVSHKRAEIAKLDIRLRLGFESPDAISTNLLEDARKRAPRPEARAATDATAIAAIPEALLDIEAIVIFTSGTTGTPKAVTHTHRSLQVAVAHISEALRLDGPAEREPAERESEHHGTSNPEGLRTFSWLPLHHLTAVVADLVALRCGVRIEVIADPSTVVPKLRELEPDFLMGMPRLFEKIREHAEAVLTKPPTRAELSPWLGTRLGFAVVGSAPTRPATLKFFEAAGLKIYEAYGMSECALPVAMNRPDAHRIGSVGPSLGDNQIKIDSRGELWLKSPGLFTGYLGTETGKRFDAEGFFRTGDVGHRDEDGFLHITGRTKDSFKTSTGVTINAAELESGLKHAHWVEEVLIVGEGRKFPLALLIPKERWSASAEQGDPRDALGPPIRQALDAVNALHSRRAGIGAALVLVAPGIANKVRGPGGKLRRDLLLSTYEDQIEEIYLQPADAEHSVRLRWA